MSETGDFLDIVFADLPGRIELRFIGEGLKPIRLFCETHAEVIAAVERAAASDKPWNSYYAACTRGPKDSGKADNLVARPGVRADIGAKVDGKIIPLDELRERFEPKLKDMGLRPSVVLESPMTQSGGRARPPEAGRALPPPTLLRMQRLSPRLLSRACGQRAV